MKQVISSRASGILLHVSSLPSPYGIGDMRHAFDFIDFLADCGQSYWQILPLGPTSPVFGNSPYMSFSAFAGNPLFISPELLHDDGLLDREDLSGPEFSDFYVEFEQVVAWKEMILAKGWQRFRRTADRADFERFCADTPWLADYSMFMALREKFDQAPWFAWPAEYRCADRQALLLASVEFAERIDYFRFEQYMFHRQWQRLREHARTRGIRIIGDLPIYVGTDSVDVWANQRIFELHATTRQPVHIAGVPPDYFSSTGQRWGNPLYRWGTRKGTVKKQLYDWWHARLAAIFAQVDVIRIDHFRGFESYWSIPGNEATAENGSWKKGPGLSFFQEMHQRLGPLPIIAEDLGLITPEVEELRDRLGYPGMKILQFAFGDNEENPYLPFNYEKNCVVFTGTHDNDTTVGWYLDQEVTPGSKAAMKRALNKGDVDAGAVHREMIYLALSSVALLTILPMQDVLGFGNDCRMNKPGTSSGNWVWRCAPWFFSKDVASWLHEETRFFNRLPREMAAGKEVAGA
ncbi:MAG: 4-alpha-glucanotransferase [Desulfobulbaceae bacterium]